MSHITFSITDVCDNGYLNKISNGHLPALDQPTKDSDEEDTNDVSPSAKQSQRPKNWSFPGSSALFLFGPTAENKSKGRGIDFFQFDSDPESHIHLIKYSLVRQLVN